MGCVVVGPKSGLLNLEKRADPKAVGSNVRTTIKAG